LKLLLFFLFLSSPVYAQEDQLFIDGAVGVGNSDGMRTINLGIQEDIWHAFKQRAIGGFWLDNSGNGKSDSGFIAAQLGFEVNVSGLVVSVFCGPGLITNPDSLLGSYFEFVSDGHVGFMDHDGYYLGGYYRHISDAGMTAVNIGRDVVGLELRVPSFF
jgi:hypothetical protein